MMALVSLSRMSFRSCFDCLTANMAVSKACLHPASANCVSRTATRSVRCFGSFGGGKVEPGQHSWQQQTGSVRTYKNPFLHEIFTFTRASFKYSRCLAIVFRTQFYACCLGPNNMLVWLAWVRTQYRDRTKTQAQCLSIGGKRLQGQVYHFLIFF